MRRMLWALALLWPVAALADWEGVDETVIEKTAEEAGRPAGDPLIDTDQGDLLLFLFLVAGAVGGFIGGYCFRGLFPPKKSEGARSSKVAHRFPVVDNRRRRPSGSSTSSRC